MLKEEKLRSTKSLRNRRGDLLLLLASLFCLALWTLTALQSRPVNDDYFLMQQLHEMGFWQPIYNYYTSFQGNASTVFITFLSEYLWLEGPSILAYVFPLVLTFLVMISGAWGALTYLGLAFPQGWRRWAVLVIAATIAWLSLAALISPNAVTLVFYFWSTNVHVWAFPLGFVALGFVYGSPNVGRFWLLMLPLGVIAGQLGTFEGALLVFGTSLAWLMRRIGKTSVTVNANAARFWTIGLTIGFGSQLISPAAVGRAGASDEAISSNIAGFNRLLDFLQSHFGPGVSEFVLGLAEIETWARILAPGAVVGDLFIRPGIIAIFILAALWKVSRPNSFSVVRPELKQRIWVLTGILMMGILLYSISGAFFAYAGRHVAGLALVASLLLAALGVYSAPWWQRHPSLLRFSTWGSIFILVALSYQQYSLGQNRAELWDQALETNSQIIRQGSDQGLIEVPLRAGLSQSGLRDHEGLDFYITLVKKWYSIN